MSTPHDTLALPEPRLEWLRADTLVPWELQRNLDKTMVRRIATNFDPDVLGTLTVIRRDGHDYLLDGQHRLAAVRDILGWGDQNLPCLVYEGVTHEQEAKFFTAQGPGKRKALSPIHALRVAYEAGDSVAVQAVTTVEAAGLKIGWNTTAAKTKNTVVAARALIDTIQNHGTRRTLTVLEFLRDGLGPESHAYAGEFIQGGMGFHIRYEGQYKTDDLVRHLAEQGYMRLRQQAFALQAANRISKRTAVGRAIWQAYNLRRRTGRLPEWQDVFIKKGD